MNRFNEILLSFDSLSIGYGTKCLLPPVSATAARGELVAVIGRNGIGKSTLLRTLLGLQPALGGKVLIDGRDMKDLSGIQKAKRIGYISTEIVRVSNMTVFDLVTFGRFPHTNWLGRIDRDSYLAVKEAIEKTNKYKKGGDTVLLSTACASFGSFQNYKERGNLFQEEVKKIKI